MTLAERHKINTFNDFTVRCQEAYKEGHKQKYKAKVHMKTYMIYCNVYMKMLIIYLSQRRKNKAL